MFLLGKFGENLQKVYICSVKKSQKGVYLQRQKISKRCVIW